MVLPNDRIVTATQADKIAAGLWYVEVHTNVFPLGIISRPVDGNSRASFAAVDW
jgi:hypothetical protein